MDAVTQTSDTLSYDGLNRLTQAVTSNPSLPLNVTKTVDYDAIGNILTKSDVGSYSYDPMRVHAVASIVPGATGTVTASYSYDANGNMMTGRGRNVSWTSFDMVSEITQGTNSVAFIYDSEHARLKQVSSDGSTKTYLNDPASGAMAERIVGASLSVTWNDYVMLAGEMIALKVSGATNQTRYFHKDHLGSIVALTDETGAVVERSSFDAWGQRRTALGEDDPLYPGLSLISQITRGFTGHEQLDSVGLVHMNGRIYEPVIGKMMSADPTVPNPIDGQAYNRYAYVFNNPLSLTDPSGFRPDHADEPDQAGPHSDRSNRGKPKGAEHSGGDGADPKGAQTAQSATAINRWDGVGYRSPHSMVTDAAAAAAMLAVLNAKTDEELEAARALLDALNRQTLGVMMSEGTKTDQGATEGKGSGTGADTTGEKTEGGSSPAESGDQPAKPAGIPDNWIEKPSKKGGGTEYVNPDDPNDRVRVMPGDRNSPYPHQREPYVIDQKGGFRDVNGNPIPGPKPRATPEAHIPYKDFQFSR